MFSAALSARSVIGAPGQFMGPVFHAAGQTTFTTPGITRDTSTAPSISGAAYTSIGATYTLNLNDGPLTNVTHWTVNWGDGNTGTINDQSSYNHIFVAPASGVDTISASVVTSSGQTFQASTTVTIAAAPTVNTFLVNNGALSRSVVTSLSVTFSEPVTVNTAGGAFTITQTATTSTLAPATIGYQLSSPNGGLTYVLSFPQSIYPQDVGNSLPDGTYSLAINPAKVVDSKGLIMETGTSYTFYRLAGDTTAQGAAWGINYLPTATINPITGATSGTPLTITANTSLFGNNSDKLSYQWIVRDNGSEVMLPGSYGSGTPLTAGETQITPIGSVITTTPQLTFIPSGNAATWTAQVITTDTSLNLSTTSPVTTFNVAANTTPDGLTTTILPNALALQTIEFNGVPILDDGANYQYTGVSAKASDGSSPGDFFSNYNPAANTYTMTQGSLSGSVQYSRLPNELDFTFSVTNNAPAASGLYFSSFIFTLAYDLHNITQATSLLSADIGEASTTLMNNGVAVGTVAVGLQEKSPGEIGFFQSGGGGNYGAQFNTAAETDVGMPDDNLYPGQTATYHAFMRFSTIVNANLGSDADQALSAQAFEQNGSLITGNESSLNWNDRRPITELFPMTDNFNNPNDYPDFAHALLTYASAEINTMLQDGSQGGITWDIADPGSSSSEYDGAPEMATTLIPQLGESVAQMGFANDPTIAEYYDPSAAGSLVDEYFAMFRNAGLKTGVTIRPTQIDPQEQTGGSIQTNCDDPVSLLIGRIEYAEQNWGCTMFYIDSIMNDSQANAIIADVHAAIPNVLLIPEHVTDGELANAAGYYQETPASTIVRTPGVSDVTSPGAQIAYPTGFIITRSDVSDPAFTSADIPTIIQSLEMGDTFFIQDPGPVLTAQQTLALNNSSGLNSPVVGTLITTQFTAPDGLICDEFSINGNIIYSQLSTNTQHIATAGTFNATGIASTRPQTSTFVGTVNSLSINTGPADTDAFGIERKDGDLTNDNVFLMFAVGGAG